MEADIRELLASEILALYSAENQLLLAIPHMASSASSMLLASALFAHLDETRQQVCRLKRAATLLAIPLIGTWCGTMETLLAEGAESQLTGGSDGLRDVRLLVVCQRVEHYEIVRYRTAILLAEECQQAGVAALLGESLRETKGAESSYRELTEMLLSEFAVGPGVQAMA